MLILSKKKDNFLVDDQTSLEIIRKVLLAIALVFLVVYTISSIAYGIKFALTLIVAYYTAREIEMLFLTHQRPMDRVKAKAYIEESKPEISGIILALLLPVSTPLYVTLIGIAFGTFVVRMAFGGFSFNIFNVAIASRVFIQVSWTDALSSSAPVGLVDYLLSLIPGIQVDYTNVNTILFNTISFNHFTISDINYLSLIVSVSLIIAFIYLSLKKIVNPASTLMMLALLYFVYYFVGIQNMTPFYIIAPVVLIVAIFALNDPITTPNTILGKLVNIAIIVIISIFMTTTKNNPYGILFALLFANMLVPIIDNTITESTKKVKVLLITLLFIVGSIYLIKTLAPTNADGTTKATVFKENREVNIYENQ